MQGSGGAGSALRSFDHPAGAGVRTFKGIYNNITGMPRGIEYAWKGNLPNHSTGYRTQGSFSVWIQPDFDADTTINTDAWGQPGNQSHYILHSDDGNAGSLAVAYYEVSKTFAFVYTNLNGVSSASVTSAEQSFTAGTPFHIAATWEKNQAIALYVNGVKTVSPQTVDPSGTACGYNLFLGNTSSPTNYRDFHGVIAEPAIFNYALSADEVTALYNATVPPVDLPGIGRRTEEVNRTHEALLFNAPFVYTANDRVGAGAGRLKYDNAPSDTAFNGATRLEDTGLTTSGTWVVS